MKHDVDFSLFPEVFASLINKNYIIKHVLRVVF